MYFTTLFLVSLVRLLLSLRKVSVCGYFAFSLASFFALLFIYVDQTILLTSFNLSSNIVLLNKKGLSRLLIYNITNGLER